MNVEVLTTNKELCVGCNKCIAKCPIKANVAFLYRGQNRVKVDHLKCIHCGACIDVCDHQARDYVDDTERFFSDLKRGLNISVIAAPSIRFNISQYQRLFGYLKSIGANLIYDVALGADITTWAYLKAIEEQRLESIIAQPCPVIVNYIQKYRPELIKNLAPIHSPMMCTAIYLRKYLNNHDQIAFLSPCIGKIDEINEVNTNGLVEYNVTYEKIEKYLMHNHIDLSMYQEVDYDQVGYGMGLTFCRPGGLEENVKMLNNDVWIRQIEGPERVYSYLDEYSKRMSENKPLPQILDILNCQNGCNLGTGTNRKSIIDDIDCKMNSLKQAKIKNYQQNEPNSGILSEYEFFFKDLCLSDFARQYDDRSGSFSNPETSDLEQVFTQLHKTTDESRSINCYACGFGNCHEFAQAVSQGTNHLGNCIDYNRKELIDEKEHLSQTNKRIKQLHYLASHDFLTDIPNRYYLEEYLNQLVLSNNSQQIKSALLFIDLDNFKVVNDSFGHASGDQILLSVVKRLNMHLGEGAFLARLGGDEFAVVLKNTDLEKANTAAYRLLEALRMEDFKVKGHQVSIKVTASIGILIIDGILDTQTIFSYADVALYTAKEEGKNRISVIQSSIDTARLSKSNRTILLINDALKEDRFTLFYQPVVKMDGTIVYYEALLRMIDQNGDLIFPNEFLPIAERFGLMSQIDRWVVNSAIKSLKDHSDLSVFVNLSASSLGDEELLRFIEDRIGESTVLPSRIGFEITETAAIKDLDQADLWIRRLKATGCKFAIDDFGVGFLTFTHLQRLPVDYLKIDGSFIRNLDIDPINKALVQAINTVAHTLNVATIAECVEDEVIWGILGELKIDFGQGYLLGRPAAIKDLPLVAVAKCEA